MKLASLKNQSRDGRLVVVNHDHTQAVFTPPFIPTLQSALDNWKNNAPELVHLSDMLNQGACKEAFAFEPTQCRSPLPRAYQWADGSAYVNHVELVRKARGAQMPDSFWHDPLMYQGGSDAFLDPTEDILLGNEEWGLDFEAEVAVVTDDVPMGASYEQAQKSIRLLMLVNDVSLRNLIPDELAKGFGFFQSKPASSFSPLALTPDELGETFDGKRLHLPLYSYLNNTLFGKPNAGVDMTFDFPSLIAHAAKTRALCAGTIIGSGTVSNRDKSVGSSCIAEKRMIEKIEDNAIKTPFMRNQDSIRIEMLSQKGDNLFGSIHQHVRSYVPAL